MGIVQGVGFRPFIYRLASLLGIKGRVANTKTGVIIDAKAPADLLEQFLCKIESDAPPAAKIKSVETVQLPDCSLHDFQIVTSSRGGALVTELPPDMATCPDCIKETLDPQDRRHGYAFTNCTSCGPRYTIIEKLPYDRQYTSMKHFFMCESCQSEYDNPCDRRFHAQPNACPECGPQLFFKDKTNTLMVTEHPLKKTAADLSEEKIVAIKGIGGFHIACDAMSDSAITCLRERKQRPFKPFAIMVKDLQTAEKICVLTKKETDQLTSFSAPIVLLTRKETAPISPFVAPKLSDIGIMLPYTPVHHLLFRSRGCPDALVMTSGNPAGEPLCTMNQEAMERLSGVVDGFLLHNREICKGVDDSVIRSFKNGHFFIRRSRGFVPAPLDFPAKRAGILGAGGDIKNTFCLTGNGSIFISQHIGNLVTGAVFDFFRKNIKQFSQLMETEIELCACDLHPDYMSSRFCMSTGLPLIKVQHHFAHAASVMAEHGITGSATAICLDGTGLGIDGTVWGGEILLCTECSFKRFARIKPFPLPGGDAAIRSPWRIAISLLTTAFGETSVLPDTLKRLDSSQILFVRKMVSNRINSPLSSSCGRLFDGAAAICGICFENSYEAQGAMQFESLCLDELSETLIIDTDAFEYFMQSEDIIKRKGALMELDWQPLFRQFLKVATRDAKKFALLFHAFLTAGETRLALLCCRQHNVNRIILSGGCMQNRILLEGFIEYLNRLGIECLWNENIPSNDGGLSLGQAFVAAHTARM